MSWFVTFVLLITADTYVTALQSINYAKNTRPKKLPPSGNNGTCTTKACENESIMIKKWLRESIDPCDNFYDFACGDVEFIPTLTSRASNAAYWEIILTLSRFLWEPLRSTDTRAARLTKIFYQSCTSRSMWNRSETDSMIDKYGGWPLRDGAGWNSERYDWIEVIKNMRIDGLYLESIFKIGVFYDIKDNKKVVLYIDQGMFRLADLYHKNNRKDVLDLVLDYAKERASAANDIVAELLDSRDFEKELEEIASTDEQSTRLHSGIRSSIRQVQIDYPYINWLAFLNGCFNRTQTLTENDILLVLDPNYFRRLGSVLERTGSRRIANYIALSTIVYGAARLYVYDKITYTTGRNCFLSTKERFPELLGAVYVKNFVGMETKSEAVQISEKIRLEFIKMLKNTPWLDNNTISEAVEKANAMKLNVAYCDAYNDNHELDEYFLSLDMQPNASYLQNTMQINKFVANALVAELGQPFYYDDYTIIEPTSNSAHYLVENNSVVIPAGILQGRYFSVERPASLNFGATGYTIGHEIAHGFDPYGSQFDRYGTKQSLFRDEAEKNYNAKAQCYEKQYSNYKHPSIANLRVNGTKTLNENIADNVGIKAAYAAYQTFIKETGSDLKLPNLNFTPNQLFWIAVAQVYCGRTFILGYRVTTDYEDDDVHAPNRYRVIGMFRNSDEFASDFQCKVGSYMNPPKDTKCELW